MTRCAKILPARALVLPLFFCGHLLQAQFMDVGITSILNVPAIVCADPTVSPRVTIKSNSEVVVTSVVIAYGVPGALPAFELWEGSLQPGQTVNHDLPPIALPGGEHLFTATASAPNGLQDEDPTNDSWSIPVKVSVPAEIIQFRLQTDNFGSDITWELISDNGTVLQAGGPYQNIAGGEVIERSFCLTNGCYTFIINDLFGDGICCGNGQGGYTLVGSDGTVYVDSDGQYGAQDVHEICLAGVQVEERHAALTLEAHPNPTRGPLWLRAPDGDGLLEVLVTDALGRAVQRMRIPAGDMHTPMDLSGLAPGMHIVHARTASRQGTLRVLLEH